MRATRPAAIHWNGTFMTGDCAGATQTPSWPGTTQLSSGKSQGRLQHTPCSQKPDAQSLGEVQGNPFSYDWAKTATGERRVTRVSCTSRAPLSSTATATTTMSFQPRFL